jgi:hypothetical protein
LVISIHYSVKGAAQVPAFADSYVTLIAFHSLSNYLGVINPARSNSWSSL